MESQKNIFCFFVINEQGKGFEGAIFELRSEKNRMPKLATSDKTGTVIFENIENGYYHLCEYHLPSWAKPKNQVIEVYINNQTTFAGGKYLPLMIQYMEDKAEN